jgi:hypothetical protein
MRNSELNFPVVQKWAYSTELDSSFERLEDEDPEEFEHCLRAACSLDQVFQFVADRRCLKRRFFASLLAEELCWVHRAATQLPFHFSSLQGIMTRAAYLDATIARAEAIYERSAYIERMRVSEDVVLREFADVLLHYRFRHAPIEAATKNYSDCMRALHERVIPGFSRA